MEEKKKTPAKNTPTMSKPKSAPAQKPRSAPASKPKSAPASRPQPTPASKPKSAPAPRPQPTPASKPKSAPAPRPQSAPASRPKSAPAQKPRSAPASKPKSASESKTRSAPAVKPEFDKLDRGETHSQKGIRNQKGKHSTLPDVEKVSEEDIPVKTVVQKQEPGVKEQVLEAGAEALMEELRPLIARGIEFAVKKATDPELYRTIGRKTKQFWNASVKPTVQAAKERRQEKKAAKKAELQTAPPQAPSAAVCDPDAQDQTTFVVSEEQAELLIEDVRAAAQDLAEKIYVLSHLCIKSEKSDAERTLEQAYIQELMSAENQKVIEQAAAHPELVGEKVALCLSDFQKGYIHTEEKFVEIPLIKENQKLEK